jgi:hypothetical protein
MWARSQTLQRPGTLATLLGCLIAAALAAAPAAEAAIGTPVDLGSSEAGSFTTGSLSITTSASAPAGASVVVTSLSQGAFPPSAASCSDGAGNGYATDLTQADSGTLTSICSTHQIAATLPAGSTVTVSWSGGSSLLNERIRAFAVTGLAAAPLDRTASAVGVGTTASSGAAPATTQPDELLVGAIVDRFNSASGAGFTPGTNGTANNCAATGTPTYTGLAGVGGGLPSLFTIHCTVAAIGTYAAQGTFGSSTTWKALLATYKAATASTATTLASSLNPSVVGQPVSFTATTVGRSPSGTVSFKDGPATLGAGALNGSGQATLTTSSLAAGAHGITAAYGGDPNNDPSSSPVLTQTVNQPSPMPSGGPDCSKLRAKLKRQKRNLKKAVSEAKRSAIEKNIKDTLERLRRRGC